MQPGRCCASSCSSSSATRCLPTTCRGRASATDWRKLSLALAANYTGILGAADQGRYHHRHRLRAVRKYSASTPAACSFFTDISMALMGRFRGGSAKIAVLGSCLFGSISGSAVANVVATGIVTIPLMKRAGYPAHKAAAIEAVASTGGQLMPPVMGAAAFLMAEFLRNVLCHGGHRRDRARAALLHRLVHPGRSRSGQGGNSAGRPG